MRSSGLIRASGALACILAVAQVAGARTLAGEDSEAQPSHDNPLGGSSVDNDVKDKKSAGKLAAQLQFGNYDALNSQLTTTTLVNCHFGPQYYGPASNSEASKEYLKVLRYYMGDNYEPVTKEGNDDPQHKTKHDESWAHGLFFSGECILKDNNLPTCFFLFGPVSRTSGTSWIARPKQEGIKFVDCAVAVDEGFVNSTTCFQDSDVQRVNVQAGYREQGISAITFYSRFEDSSADGPPATYNLAYRCQFAFNSPELFNPFTNEFGLDPRLTSWAPNYSGGGKGVGSGGQVGPPGNGGYSGPGQLPGLQGGPESHGNTGDATEAQHQKENGVGSLTRSQSG